MIGRQALPRGTAITWGPLPLLLALTIAGCGDRGGAPPAADHPVKPAASAEGAEGAEGAERTERAERAEGAEVGADPLEDAEAPLPEVAPIDAAAVQALVDAWLAAQNSDDFAAYTSLYADKMEGVKRAGPRVRRFDREGWLADRKKMFDGKPMTVAIRDLEIGGSAAAPTARFVQRFQQGKFTDEGPKEVVLTRTPEGLRIAREELLASVIGGGAAAASGDAIALVLEIEGRHHVVLADDVDPSWGRGALRGPLGHSPMLAIQRADPGAAGAGWAGKRMAVITADGRRCDATIGALRLVSGGTPHFGEVQVWDGDPGMSPDGRKWPRAERARAVFGMTSPSLIGELTIEGGCAPAYAIEADARVTPYAAEAIDDARSSAAIAAFRALPAYAEIQRSWSREGEGEGEWVRAPKVAGYVAGDRHVVVVSAHEGVGCGGFEGALTALFTDVDGRLAPIAAPAESALSVVALVDVDGEGPPEIVGDPADFSVVTALLAAGASGYAPVKTIEFPFRDCGC